MQPNSASNDDNISHPLLVAPFTTSFVRRYTRRQVLSLGAIVLFSVSKLSACDTSNSPCMLSNSTPTCKQPSNATPKPKPTSTPTPTPSPTPTASSTPPIDPKALVHDETVNYYQLILHGLYSAAYAMLSADQQARISPLAFQRNQNYSLSRAECWKDSAIYVSQRLDGTWDADLELAQVTCIDGSPLASFDWHFQWQWQADRLVIIYIGLYATAPGNL